MKNKKGFTLVELLAVIVILAVLVLLAVPSVIKMMDNSKKNSFVVEAENIIGGAKLAYADSLLNSSSVTATTVTVSINSVPVTGKCFSIANLANYLDKKFKPTAEGSVLVDAANNKNYIWYYDETYSVTAGVGGAVAADAATNATRTNWGNCSVSGT